MPHPTTTTIGFIGAGNMARSLAGGLLKNGFPAARLRLADPDPAQRAAIKKALGLDAEHDNDALARECDTLILAVKPQALRAAARALAPAAQARRPLVISIAAGVRLPDLDAWLGGGLPLVRAMPNTPALIGAGASGMYANARVSDDQRSRAESILRAVGTVVWVADEGALDAVTALSGSGPAYFFLMMEALEQAGVALGLDTATSRLLTLETAFGAAKMALESGEEPAQLRARVTSPGGTTERALETLERGELRALIARAVDAACARSRELGTLLGRST